MAFFRKSRLALTLIFLAGVATFAGGFALRGQSIDDSKTAGSCSKYDNAIQAMGYTTKYLQEWPEKFHTDVAEGIQELFEPPVIDCHAETPYDLVALDLDEESKLYKIAKDLPPWQDPVELAKLTRMDAGPILLEYLRVYECMLKEFDTFLPIEVRHELHKKAQDAGDPDRHIEISDIAFYGSDYEQTINHELAATRKAIEQSLTILMRMERLRAIEAEFECLQRASLDIRNIASLTADSAVCLPRMWDAKDPLRDMKEP